LWEYRLDMNLASFVEIFSQKPVQACESCNTRGKHGNERRERIYTATFLATVDI
jgi:hypothetical protein